MASKGNPRTLLVDTSVAVPLVLQDHYDHAATALAIGDRRIGLAGHAAIETYRALDVQVEILS